MLGGHEFSELDLKERLRLLMNKVPFFLLFEFFLLIWYLFSFFWALSWWEHVDFLKMCITVDVVDLFSSKICSRLSYTHL